jgi:ankyrin repeat protein
MDAARHLRRRTAGQDRANPSLNRVRSRARWTRTTNNITPLHLAAINGRAEARTYLIEQGADVDAVGGTLFATPLQWAARNGPVYIVDLLLRQGANPRILDVQGYSCLHSVTHLSNYWALLYVLCQPETEIDERDSMGYTALHWAVYQRDEVSTEVLLKLGADPNVVGDDGLTLLHWAAYSG